MEIKVKSHPDNDDDCRRTTFYTTVRGQRYDLAACALETLFTMTEILNTAQRHFGADVRIDWNGHKFQ